MVYIKNLKITNYKSISEVTIDFNKDINIFIGPNNCGKTNILKCLEEAILYNEDSFKNVSKFNNPKDILPKVTLETSSGNIYHYNVESPSPTIIFASQNTKVYENAAIRHINKAFKVASYFNMNDNTNLISEMTEYITSIETDASLIKFLSSINRDMGLLSNESYSLSILKNQLYINDSFGDTSLIKDKSSGVQKMIILAYFLNKFSFEDSDAPDFILLDEPEVNLHSEAQRHLFKRLKEKFKDSQLFITSHSPIFINSTDLNQIFLVKRDLVHGTYIDYEKKTKNKISKLNAILGLNLLDSLRINSSSSIILVEGPSDKLIHNYIFKRHFPQKTVEFFSVSGADHLVNYLTLFEEVFIDSPLAILDYDAKGLENCKKIKEKKREKYQYKVVTNIGQFLADISSFSKPKNDEVVVLEDLFEIGQLKKFIHDFYMEKSRKDEVPIDGQEIMNELKDKEVVNFTKITGIPALRKNKTEINKIELATYIIEQLKKKNDEEFKDLTKNFKSLYEKINKNR
ncbi:ATP-dependent nuclease [Macrococcus brunensis]|uniref:ATP-dependent nuclease n=1 Tax=Macrococcus brunensis TaxID=198483 RepID=UPI001EEFCD02|nr:AAA family ATPase [Macrococcus brunensis]ULG71396.1 AAA family ATPase [Macrococcus brunensis]